jgi:hypothetical protein
MWPLFLADHCFGRGPDIRQGRASYAAERILV